MYSKRHLHEFKLLQIAKNRLYQHSLDHQRRTTTTTTQLSGKKCMHLFTCCCCTSQQTKLHLLSVVVITRTMLIITTTSHMSTNKHTYTASKKIKKKVKITTNKTQKATRKVKVRPLKNALFHFSTFTSPRHFSFRRHSHVPFTTHRSQHHYHILSATNA